MRDLMRGLAALAASLFLATAAPAQRDPQIDMTRDRLQLEGQRIAKDIDIVLEEAGKAYRQGRTADAVRQLDATLDFLDRTTLLDSTRAELKGRVQRALAYYKARPNDPGPRPDPVVRRPPPVDRGPDPGKVVFDDARRIIGSRSEQLASLRDLQRERSERLGQVWLDVYKSSMPPKDDIEFPADWVEKSKRRSPAMQMTEKERAIMRGLNKTIAPDFKGQTFQQVIDYLSKAIGAPIILDPNALREVGAEYTSPVNLTSPEMSVRSVLKKVLADFQLTYIVKDETIQVMTPARARETLTTRTYYIGDLITASGAGFGLGTNPFQVMQQANDLMFLIQTTIEPNSWAYKEGPGSMYFHPGTMTIVVKQTAEVHMMLGVGLR
jgi:hypothetical protein